MVKAAWQLQNASRAGSKAGTLYLLEESRLTRPGTLPG
jgi:hypothetical protein